MKVKLAAGAEFDVLTAKEMRAEMDGSLTGFAQSLALGDSYRRFSTSDQVAADGTLTLAGAELGPREGMIWCVKRLSLFGLADTQSVALYVNDTGPSAGVHPRIARVDAGGVTPYVSFDTTQLVLMPGDSLVIAGATLTAGAYITVTGQARELPRSLLWRL